MTGVSVFKDLEEHTEELVDLTEGEIAILQSIQSAVASLAAARGIASDLRVTVVAQPSTVIGSGTITTVTTVTTVATLTNQAQMGTIPTQYVVPAAQNALAAGFGANIDRGNGGARYG